MAFLLFGAHMNPFNWGGHLGIFNSPTTANFSGIHAAAFNSSTSFAINPLSFTDFAHFGSHVHSPFGSINFEQTHLPQFENPFGSSLGVGSSLGGSGQLVGVENPNPIVIDLTQNLVGTHTINLTSTTPTIVNIGITAEQDDHTNTINDVHASQSVVNLNADVNGHDVINNNPSGGADIVSFAHALGSSENVTINNFSTPKDFLEFNTAEQSTLHVTQNGANSVHISDTLGAGGILDLTINATTNLTATNFIADFVHIIT